MTIFTKKSFKLMGLCLLLMVIGYILLGQGPDDNYLSRSVAPVILVMVYCVLIPLTIILTIRQSKPGGQHKSGSEETKGV